MLEKIFVFIFGSIVGSFLNVCIHRMPLGESVVNPPSHCPGCKKPIPWKDNIPLLSFVLLRGKCRSCKSAISLRYFCVELLTALAFLLFFNIYGLSFNFVIYSVFVCGLIVATFVDLKHRIIPDEISVGGIVVGLILAVLRGMKFSPFSFSPLPVLDSFLGVIIGGGIIWLSGFCFDIIYFKLLKRAPIQGETESMGGGDVKLLAMIGAFLGWKMAVLTFFLSPVLGAIAGVVNLIITKDHTIPYGPFLSLSAIISLFWSNKIIKFLLGV